MHCYVEPDFFIRMEQSTEREQPCWSGCARAGDQLILRCPRIRRFKLVCRREYAIFTELKTLLLWSEAPYMVSGYIDPEQSQSTEKKARPQELGLSLPTRSSREWMAKARRAYKRDTFYAGICSASGLS